jgi:presenilin 1
MSKVEVKENLLHGSGQINQTPEVEFHPTESQDQVTEDDGPDYSVDHLSAVVRPVALTMILSSLTVAKIRDPNTDSALGNGLSVYLVYNEGTNANQSSGEILGQAAINALVIVSVICAATFVLVGCYYFRCLKLMLAYLVFACINLLGFSGGFLVYSALLVYRVPIDLITLGILMYNFAVGGAIAVFWQKGIPRYYARILNCHFCYYGLAINQVA